MVFDFILLSVGTTSSDDDLDGKRTIEYLKRCRRVMLLILSSNASSVGLHPAVYFYSWTGKQQPILFLTIASIIVDYERDKKLPKFIECRASFEAFLIENRSLVNQIIRKFGTKESGANHLRLFYTKILDLIEQGKAGDSLIKALLENATYSYLQPGESPYSGVSPTRFSTQVKSGYAMGELLKTAPRCPICQGLLPSQALSTDHIERRADGGPSTIDNAQLTHPYCNTGYKESQLAKARRGVSK